MSKASRQTDTYRKWWKGKRVRPVDRSQEFKMVTDVEFIGPPSAVYGIAVFYFEDGTKRGFQGGDNSFKPRKKDFEIDSK